MTPLIIYLMVHQLQSHGQIGQLPISFLLWFLSRLCISNMNGLVHAIFTQQTHRSEFSAKLSTEISNKEQTTNNCLSH